MTVAPEQNAVGPVRVFISYSHDSPGHSERVLDLAWALRRNGSDVELDQFHNEEIVDWPRWCNEQTSHEHSDFVICICTAEYRRRIEGKVPPEKGKGVHWEDALLDDDLYDEKRNCRIIPVLLDNEPESSIPRFLRGWTHCRISQFTLSNADYEHLVRILTHQAKVEKNDLGPVPILSTEHAPDAVRTEGETGLRADISRILKYAPAELIGREEETKLLNDAWAKVQNGEKGRPHVLTIVALGGEGKTALVAKWAAKLAGQDWPGCDAAFAWSFYSQGAGEKVAADSDLFLKAALTFLAEGDPNETEIKAFAASNAGAFEKGQRLARLVGQRRSLLILDGLEPLQYAPTAPTPGELKDQGLAALLRTLAVGSDGLCIVTTRYSLPDLKAFWQTTAPEVELRHLSRDAGVHLLKRLGVKGSELRNLPLKDGDEKSEKVNEFEKLVEDVKGHALTLTLLGSYLREAHGGDIRKRDLVKLEEADDEIVVIPGHPRHAFHVMDAYVEWFEGGVENDEENRKGLRALAILRLLGLFDRPATADCLSALWSGDPISNLTEPLVGMKETQRNVALTRLEDARLLTVNRDPSGALVSLDAHPHIREYFAKQLREKNPDGWRTAHRRLYEHLCATTKEGNQPTLEDLQPLYQAVAHGCQAGLQQEACDDVYFARISRGKEAYAVKKLGVFGSDSGAVACFFDTPWSRVSPEFKEYDQAWLLGQAAFRLRALGRLTECVEPMRAATTLMEKQEEWKQAAISASNLSELELTLGQVAGAVGDAEQSVTYADRSGDAFERMSKRTTHADALHQACRRREAETLFREAEQMQKEQQPDYPLLYSLQGFRYCDLLLATSEHAAWQTTLSPRVIPAKAGIHQGPTSVDSRLRGSDKPVENNALIESCREIEQRAAQTLKIAERNNWLLDIAFDHLTLGRAALYEGILERSQIRNSKSQIEDAVSGLRRAGQQDDLPRGLLTRAWLRFLEGDHDGAKQDLDEAWEIAERGPMKLFMADIHLYRARLFGPRQAETKYPWRSPQEDLAAAEKLILRETTYQKPDGTVITARYARRDEELADAKKAAKGW